MVQELDERESGPMVLEKKLLNLTIISVSRIKMKRIRYLGGKIMKNAG